MVGVLGPNPSVDTEGYETRSVILRFARFALTFQRF